MMFYPRQSLLAVMACCGILLLPGCPAKPEIYQMGEAIEMGPFVFEVEGATEEVNPREKVINVNFRLHIERSAPFKKPFGEFLSKMHLVDTAGNKIDIWGIGPVSGNQLSATEWRARVRLDQESRNGGDAENLGDRPRDFRLIVINPDPREGQARRVSIQLR